MYPSQTVAYLVAIIATLSSVPYARGFMGKSGPRLRGSGRKQQVLLSLLRKVREDGGLRQEDVARVFGWDKTFVSKYETGVRRLDLLELDELCKVCGISLVDFVKRYRRALEKKVPRQ